MIDNIPGKTYTFGDTRRNRRQGLVGKTYTTSPSVSINTFHLLVKIQLMKFGVH